MATQEILSSEAEAPRPYCHDHEYKVTPNPGAIVHLTYRHGDPRIDQRSKSSFAPQRLLHAYVMTIRAITTGRASHVNYLSNIAPEPSEEGVGSEASVRV